jgi:aldehyde dehydrogenase (NAD+)
MFLLPGVGESGMGSYHGKLTFDTFTHRRAVILSSGNAWTDVPIRYAPYTPYKVSLSLLLQFHHLL